MPFRVTYSTPSCYFTEVEVQAIIAFIEGVVGVYGIRQKDPRFGNIYLVRPPADQEEAMKEALRQSPFNGCGLAVLGMKQFDMDNPVLTFQFPTGKDAHNFLDWLGNSGEQGFYEGETCDPDYDGSHLYFRYHDPGGNVIPVVRLRPGKKG